MGTKDCQSCTSCLLRIMTQINADIQVIGSGTTLYPHVTPDSWIAPLQALTSIHKVNGQTDSDSDDEEEPIIALIKGPKRSGKSTFARAVLNNLLTRYDKVAWLECDLGQGEFSPGGSVGLWILDKPLLGKSPPFPAITHIPPHRCLCFIFVLCESC
jgi:polynucleotide 5'-kinase involved in rRNA processing